jgi:hypothetical protein
MMINPVEVARGLNLVRTTFALRIDNAKAVVGYEAEVVGTEEDTGRRIKLGREWLRPLVIASFRREKHCIRYASQRIP